MTVQISRSMRPSTADSRRTLLCVLFCLFETLLVASVIILLFTEPRRRPVTDAAGLTFWFAFVGLFAVTLILRRAAPRLAVIGWLTLLGGFWSLAFVPPA